jgi:hypothetical protein
MSEEDTVPAGIILKVLGAVVAGGVLLCVVAALVLHLRERQLRPSLRFPEGETARSTDAHTQLFQEIHPPPPEDRWAWVDREKRLVRIPIDDAMELVAKGARP